MLEAHLDQVVDGRLNQTLRLVASKYSRSSLNWVEEPCKTKGDSYWLEDRKRSFNDQFCIRIGFLSNVVDGATGEVFQAWARELVATGVGYSREMPFVQVTRFTPYDFLSMVIAFDPEAHGVTRSKRAERTFNDWQPQTLAGHPDRIAFYEALKSWAPTFAQAAARAFEGDAGLSALDFGSPSFSKR